jgi:hypothetical protein
MTPEEERALRYISETQNAPKKPPAGGTYVMNGGVPWLIYELQPGSGVWMGFSVSPGSLDVSQMGTPRQIDNGTWASMNVRNSGDAKALASWTKSFQDTVAEAIDTHIGHDPAARTDPGILGVVADLVVHSNMSDAELSAKMQKTSWYQRRTDGQRKYNNSSEADQKAQLDSAKSAIAEKWFNTVGEPITPDDPRIADMALKYASGQMGLNAIVDTYMRPAAEKNPESPWARTKRTEQVAQNEHGFDIGNQGAAVRDLGARWGIKLSDQTIGDWAGQMVNKTMSQDQVVQNLKQMAQVAFPWKSPDMETSVAASPWIQTYQRVMERTGDVFTPDIQKALNGSQSLYDFEKTLKQSAGWLDTKNAREELTSMASQVGQRFGFVK